MRALVCGAGGFIGGHLVKRLIKDNWNVRAVDKKPVGEWYQSFVAAQNICADLSSRENCEFACAGGVDWVFQLAADMGGMGFIEKYRIECMRSVLINVHMLEAVHNQGVKKIFFSSSACVYNTDLQAVKTKTVSLKESDAYPALAERGYGWEKLYSEMLYQEYSAERGLPTRIARFHNVYGPHGTWRGGREKAPSALSRKVAEAKLSGKRPVIQIWGDGLQRRSYMWIGDCIEGIMKIMICGGIPNATPINLGSSQSVSVNRLLDMIAEKAGLKHFDVEYQPNAPKGVKTRNSDNTLIKELLGWEPSTRLEHGLGPTYDWVRQQVLLTKRGGKVLS